MKYTLSMIQHWSICHCINNTCSVSLEEKKLMVFISK